MAKYIITDKNEVRIGENTYHDILAEDVEGKVISAGHCEKLEDGWTVFGGSIGFGIFALNSDRDLIEKYYGK